MSAPRLEACYFGSDSGEWTRLAQVLESTARQQCPTWDILVRHITPTSLAVPTGVRSHAVNTQKLAYWAARVQAADEGDRVLLIDADTCIVNPLDPIWDQPFDLAYAVRHNARYPLNGGVIFLRISDRVKRFVSDWRAENDRMLLSPQAFGPWRASHGGINQAALGSMLLEAKKRGDLAVRRLTCGEWNCEDSAWATFDPATTRIVHVKSALRRAVLYRYPSTPEIRPLVALWRRLELEAARRPQEVIGA